MLLSFKHIVQNEYGFHARPIGKLVKLIRDIPCDITVSTAKKTANAKSIFSLMALTAKQGQELTITCDGPNDKTTFLTLICFFKNNV